MKQTLLSILIAAAVAAIAPIAAHAQQATPAARQNTPSQIVLSNSTRILTTLENRREEFTKDRVALRQFMTSEFNQMFDRDYSGRLVLGRHGRGASEADVKLFSDALAENLMQRYGASLLDFNTQLKVRVKSESALPGGRGVRVSSEFLRAGGEPIPVDYLMRQVGGQWKVFDVMVEGVSYVQTFRTQFDTPLSQKSIAQVAAELKAGSMQADAAN
ncbi:phospholipid transport system substrate-binding protein [Luteimonas cucumeris]|uniref:Phospholipid transport system substrate-binding protein n=1 Tax=Luteimonas cucumeris TaxID=985012 RepID=A0A562KWB5_9GAMM|nr:ABC transporter substrate-binding protein [Luteimonas cucumeris]TWH99710.1 phospholipid transport system substrate-binding protein [Luteimonas cucumeris]